MQLATSPTITTRIVLKNKMSVKLGATITPIIFTSSSIMNRNGICNNTYTLNNKRILVVLDFRQNVKLLVFSAEKVIPRFIWICYYYYNINMQEEKIVCPMCNTLVLKVLSMRLIGKAIFKNLEDIMMKMATIQNLVLSLLLQ